MICGLHIATTKAEHGDRDATPLLQTKISGEFIMNEPPQQKGLGWGYNCTPNILSPRNLRFKGRNRIHCQPVGEITLRRIYSNEIVLTLLERNNSG